MKLFGGILSRFGRKQPEPVVEPGTGPILWVPDPSGVPVGHRVSTVYRHAYRVANGLETADIEEDARIAAIGMARCLVAALDQGEFEQRETPPTQIERWYK